MAQMSTLKKIFICVLLVFFTIPISTQKTFSYPVIPDGIAGDPRIEDLSGVYGYPSAVFEWEFDGAVLQEENIINISHRSLVTFTGLSVGWVVETSVYEAEDFEIHIRTREISGQYGEWYLIPGEYHPEANPSGLYWSDLYLTPDEEAHSEFQIKFTYPGEASLSLIRVSAADASSPEDDLLWVSEDKYQLTSSGLMPQIIKRDEWWGSLCPGQMDSPDWLPQAIMPSHGIIHHTATQNNPSNPAQAVRNIWHYHAMSLGWGDIGYNYLIDQYGNIYQGRNNPWLDTTDVRAGHAGLSNSKSFGVALLGQFHPTSTPLPDLPTLKAIASLEQLISWRFSQYNLDPLGSAVIETRRYGFINVPRICGHRDVAATACPGDSLHEYMPSIRANVNKKVKDNTKSVFRLFGINRYQTAVEISQTGWPEESGHIILARGDDYADALAGVPLAYRLNSPILLTSNSRLDASAANEIQRLKANQAIILGGYDAISAQLELDIEGLGLQVKRIAGENRYETAVKIADEMSTHGVTFDTAFIAVSTDFADALSASSYAARKGNPIFMTRKESLPESTSRALADMGIKNTIVVGGTSAISPGVFDNLPNPKRISGNNRYATSVALAEEFLPQHMKEIFLATGLDFPDAIAGAVLAAKRNSGVLLVQGNSVEPNQEVQEFISSKGINGAFILGGNEAVSAYIENWCNNNLGQ